MMGVGSHKRFSETMEACCAVPLNGRIRRGSGKGENSKRYGVLFLLCAFGLLCQTASARPTHPCGYYDPDTCPTPNVPSDPQAPTVNYDGRFAVTSSGDDQYAWIEIIGNRDPDKDPGQYYYAAKQCINTGERHLCSDSTPSVKVTVVTPPDAPTMSLDVEASVCATSLNLDWSAGSGYPDSVDKKYYELQESKPDPGTRYIAFGTSPFVIFPLDIPPDPPETYTVEGASVWSRPNPKENETYIYKVRSYYDYEGYTSHESAWSSSVSVTIPQCTPGHMDAPLVERNGESIDVSWSEPSKGKAEYYILKRQQRSIDSGEWTEWSEVYNNAALEHSDPSSGSPELDRGYEYRYKVQGRNNESIGDQIGYFSPESESVYIPYARPGIPALDPVDQDDETAGTYSLSWSNEKIDGVTGDVTYWIRENSGDWVSVGTSTTKTYQKADPVGTYAYEVAACNEDAGDQSPAAVPDWCSGPSETSTITIPGQPGVPGIAYTAGDDYREHSIAWTAPSDGDSPAGYTVQRSINGADEFIDVGFVQGLDIAIQGDPGSRYRYRVRARIGAFHGAYQESSTTYWVPKQPTPVSAPVNVDDPFNPTITVGWDGHQYADHYLFQQKVKPDGGAWGDWSTPPVTIESGSERGPFAVDPGNNYEFKVKACNSRGACSPAGYSKVIEVDYPAPAQPSGLSVTPLDAAEGRVRLDWNQPGDTRYIDNYHVQYKTPSQLEWQDGPEPRPTGTTDELSGLTGGQNYQFQVSACNEDGCGDPVQTDFQMPPPPPILGVMQLDSGSGTSVCAPIDGQLNTDWAGEYTLCWMNADGSAQVDTVNAYSITYTEDENGQEQEVKTPIVADETNPPPAGLQTHFFNHPPHYDEDGDEETDRLLFEYRAEACGGEKCSTTDAVVAISPYPLPGEPTNLSIAGGAPSADGSYTLQWGLPDGNDDADVHFYQIDVVDESDLDGDGNDTEDAPDCDISADIVQRDVWDTCGVEHIDGQSPSAAFTGGEAGRTYRYRVNACYGDQGGCDDYTQPIKVYVPHNPPGEFKSENLNAAEGSFDLTWQAPAGVAVDTYQIEQSRDGGQSWPLTIDGIPGTATRQPLSGRDNGQEYMYRIRACAGDNDCGAYSETVTVYVPYLKPAVPDSEDFNIESLDPEAGSVSLSWIGLPTEAAPIEHFLVQHRVDGAAWADPVQVAASYYNATDLANGRTHEFQVAACNRDVCNEDAEAEYTAPVGDELPYKAPARPGALSHDENDLDSINGRFTIHWNAPAAIDPDSAPVQEYKVEYSPDGANWLPAPITEANADNRIDAAADVSPGDAADATLTGLDAGTAYSVRVAACNDVCGPATPAYQVYLPRPAPPTPSLAVSDITRGSTDYQDRRFTVGWQLPDGVFFNHYQLQVYTESTDDEEGEWVNVQSKTQATEQRFIERRYGRSYRYRVRACAEPQSACSDWADTGEIRLRYPVPGTPTGVVVDGDTYDPANGKYTLTWNGVPGWAPSYSYQLQQAPAEPEPGEEDWHAPIGATGDWLQVNETGFEIEDQPAGDYLHRVRACNPDPEPANDCGAWSPAGAVTVIDTPARPQAINVDAGSCRFNITWTPPAEVSDGQYYYELARVTGDDGDDEEEDDREGLIRTQGTSHDMVLNSDTDDENYVFSVRVRTLENGFYSAWSDYRTATAVPAKDCDSAGDSEGGVSVTAPPYSETGQYEVTMRADNPQDNITPDYRVRANGGSWEILGGATVTENNDIVFTTQYEHADPQPTGRYQYRIQACYYSGTSIPDVGACDSFVEAITGTTVVRDPGSVGPLELANVAAPTHGAYRLDGGLLDLSWSAAPNPGPYATQHYEVQYKKADSDDWTLLSQQGNVGISDVRLPEFGVPFDYRVRACRSLGDYVNCGSWAGLDAPVIRAMGPPRPAADIYPVDRELVIYDRRVPIQWLPPTDRAAAGDVHHYQISMSSQHVKEGGETYWLGPDVMRTNIEPDTNSNGDALTQQSSVEVAQSGLKEFQVRACGSMGSESCGEAFTFEITVIVPPEPPEPGTLSGQGDPDSGGDPFNGALSGQFSVQPSGAASYSLPITVPPGTNGMQPEISLNYNSQGGNSIAGLGWSIGGLSSISPCNRTLAQDGRIDGIDYDAYDTNGDDAYCMDGQRLIEVADDTYRLEKNDFRRVKKMAGGACGPWFKVQTQSGKTFEYGNTNDSCFIAQRPDSPGSVINRWAVNKVTDLAGNYIRYGYIEESADDGNELAIQRIEYTGNDGGHGEPYTAIHFQYEDRPDPSSGFQAGVKIEQTRRLDKIITGVNPDAGIDNPDGYGTYDLTYAPEPLDEPFSRLTSIEYCAETDSSNGKQCMDPLEFEWSEYEHGWERLAGDYDDVPPFADEDSDRGARLIDLNNDALPDLLYSSQEHGRSAWRNTGSGWAVWPKFEPDVDFLNNDGQDCGVRFADLNGDNRPDMLTSVDIGGVYQAYENTESGWQARGSHPTRFHNGYCEDNGARLADLDGDGFTDLILGKGNERDAWRNPGVDYSRWDDWSSVGASYEPSQFAGKRIHNSEWRPRDASPHYDDKVFEPTAWFVDLNGDGLVDILEKDVPHEKVSDPERSEKIQYHGRINDGSRWVSTDTFDEHSYIDYYQAPDGGTYLADFNGDGLVDFMRANSRSDIIKLGTGNGWVDAPLSGTPLLTFMTVSNTLRTRSARIVDVNADGRSDLLFGRQAWLATESGWKEDYRYVSPVEFDDPRKARGVRLTDLNGDGRLDLLQSYGSTASAWTIRSERPRLVGVSDGLGNTTEVKYGTLTDPSPEDGRNHPLYTSTTKALDKKRLREMKTPMQVVDRVTAGDGLGGTQTTEYAYKGLIADIRGRGMQGFEEMVAYKPDDTVVTTHYAQRFPYTGMPLEVIVRYREDGLKLSHTQYEYCHAVTGEANRGDIDDPESASFVWSNAVCGVDSPIGAYDDINQVSESVALFSERSVEITNRLNDDLTAIADSTQVETVTAYGRYGYPSESEVITTGDGSTYRTVTHHDYNTGLPDGRWLGRIRRTTVESTTPEGSSTRTTDYEYDPVTTLPAKQITEPTAQPQDRLKQVTVYARDEYGNVTETGVCARDFSSCHADPDTPNKNAVGRNTTTVYDNQGRFPVETINALDHRESREYDHPLGLKTRHLGPNDLETSWQYDALGRKQEKHTPFAGKTEWRYRKATGGFVSGARYKVDTIGPTGEASLSRTYYDSRGRERRSMSRNLHGEWVAADTEYDRRGRVKRESEPFFVLSSVAADRYWTEYDYDDIGRVQQTRVPLGDIDNDGAENPPAVSTTDYQGFTTVVTDAKGRDKLEQVDALGRTVRRVDDRNGADQSVVQYIYDSRDNLTRTVVDDNPDTAVVLHYDLRNRKTSMSDPDMGDWSYTYNGYGELIRQIDAKGQITQIRYDKLGRKTYRADNADTTDPEADISGEERLSEWTYHGMDAPAGSRGKLDSEQGPDGTRKGYTYTDEGQLHQVTHHIDVTGDNDKAFTVTRQYDPYGRVWRMVYPQTPQGGTQFTVENHYSDYGGLWYVSSPSMAEDTDDEEPPVLWVANVVDQRGQVVQETMRNQTTASRDYNAATGWLKKIESWDKNTRMIQRTSYAFDPVGNMAWRERFRPWVVEPDGSGYLSDSEEVREEFDYDRLDRLTGAETYRNASAEPEYSQSYNYDDLGNLLHKDSITNGYDYTGCSGGPHAVCAVNGGQSAGGTSFYYDANGNMYKSEGAKARNLQYSAFNKPVWMEENGTEVTFTYGADRSRVHKTASANGHSEQTWYVGLGGEGNPLYELHQSQNANGDSTWEHQFFVYAGGHHNGRPFASYIEADTTGDGVLDDKYAQYYHRDHLGSVIAVTDEDGAVNDPSTGRPRAQLMSFDAFGKRRGADWSVPDEADEDYVDQYTRGSLGNLDYTGQEAVPEVGLIHMNGRVYDPELGRFMSADPHVQFAENPQSFNRYSYVMNNPIRYNDPSGYFVGESMYQDISPQGAQVISTALSFVPYCTYWCSAVFNARWTYANTGNMSMAMEAGTMSLISSTVGSYFGNSMMGAGITGSIMAGLNALRTGDNVHRAAFEGGLRAMATAGIIYAIQQGVSAMMQPDGTNQPKGNNQVDTSDLPDIELSYKSDLLASNNTDAFRTHRSVAGKPVLDANGEPLVVYKEEYGLWTSSDGLGLGEGVDEVLRASKNLRKWSGFPVRDVEVRRVKVYEVRYYEEVMIPEIIEYDPSSPVSTARSVGLIRGEAYLSGNIISVSTHVRSYYQARPVSFFGIRGDPHYLRGID